MTNFNNNDWACEEKGEITHKRLASKQGNFAVILVAMQVCSYSEKKVIHAILFE